MRVDLFVFQFQTVQFSWNYHTDRQTDRLNKTMSLLYYCTSMILFSFPSPKVRHALLFPFFTFSHSLSLVTQINSSGSRSIEPDSQSPIDTELNLNLIHSTI
ncbi:hypothetical protein RIF29_13532 [Crotalaria pallida]|uniref:Uncharacterized protein n=1 Tax=Crotalaria pallida TaxID=3830 RepID=A0AAN9IPK1_CROPI